MIVRGSVVFIEAIVAMAITQWKLCLIALTALSPIILLTTCFNNRFRVLRKEIQEKKGIMTQTAEECFGNIRTVKAFANEKEEAQKFKDGSDGVKSAECKKMLF